MSPDEILAAAEDHISATRRYIEHVERTKEEQPERLAAARAAADEACGWSLIEEPFEEQCAEIPALNSDNWLTLPNFVAKELWGARLCFDLLDAGEDFDQIDAILARLFTTVGGDTGTAMLIMSAALSTIAGVVVPQFLEEIETRGSNYEARTLLAEARRKAWNQRANVLRKANEAVAESGVNPIDTYDIGTTALDPDEDF
jgi:hypothetical protein